MGPLLGCPLKRPRIVVFAPSRLGSRIAGPNLRALAIARGVGRRFDTTLAIPPGSTPPEGEPFATCSWTRAGARRLLRGFDVAISQGTQYPARAVVRSALRRPLQVFDLYDPVLFENAAEASHLGRLTALLLRRADFVVCASARQRDLYAAEAQSRVGIVPFGHDGALPRRTARVLKGVWPGIAAEDKVLLWGGGVWSWLDPLTAIRAVAALPAERRARLVFLGSGHPDHAWAERRMLCAARALAAELGALGRTVFFNDRWVPHDRRHDHLLEADLAVCAAPDGRENRFAFRTRLVDAVWAGLPVVTTRGEGMADFVEAHGIGATVPAGDADALARAIGEELNDPTRARRRANLERCRDRLSWERCLQPLFAFLDRVHSGEHARPREPLWTPWVQYLRYKVPAMAERVAAGLR